MGNEFLFIEPLGDATIEAFASRGHDDAGRKVLRTAQPRALSPFVDRYNFKLTSTHGLHGFFVRSQCTNTRIFMNHEESSYKILSFISLKILRKLH